MPRVLQRVPVQGEPLRVRDETVVVREDQIIVWVSLSVHAQSEWHSANPRFPAVLDTGNSHHFFIHEGFLRRWAGMRPEALREVRKRVTSTGPPLSERLARIWLHRNQPGKRDVLADEPFLLEKSTTIMVCAENHPKATRLPVLGLRAIFDNDLVLRIDGPKRQVSLRTAARWWWPF
jgi:hypothetical protein